MKISAIRNCGNSQYFAHKKEACSNSVNNMTKVGSANFRLADLNDLSTKIIDSFEEEKCSEDKILNVNLKNMPDGRIQQVITNKDGKVVAEITKNSKSNEKVMAMTGQSGFSLFVITSDGLVYKMSPSSKFSTDNLKINVPQVEKYDPSFEGNLYVSTSKNEHSQEVKDAVNNFWISQNLEYFKNTKSIYSPKLDYNLFLPAGGKGTRSNSHKIKFSPNGDYNIDTPKPAIEVPVKPFDKNGKDMSFIELSLSSFVFPNIINDKTQRYFIEEEECRGNAYSLITSLENGEIPTDKPLFVSYADSISDVDFRKFMHSYETHSDDVLALLTAVVMNRESVPQIGLFNVKKNENDDLMQLVDLVEKTTDENIIKRFELPNGKFLSNRSFYILPPPALKALKIMAPDLEKAKNVDFMKEIFPLLMDISMGNPLKIEIEPERLEQAKKIIGDKKLYVDMLGGRRSDVGNLRKFVNTSNMIANGEFNLPQKVVDIFKECTDKNGCVYMPGTKVLSDQYLQKNNGQISGNILVDKVLNQ